MAVLEETGPTDEQLKSITYLDCDGNNKAETERITNTSGLEKMTNLETLILTSNQIEKIDVSKNTKLTQLDLSFNPLSSIYINNNKSLRELFIEDARLKEINISENTELTSLWVDRNQLTSIDISKNTALVELGIYDTQLTSIDLSKNAKLNSLYLYDTQLTSIDISHNTALESLDVDIPVKTLITRSYSSTPTIFDLSSLLFLGSVIPGEGYSFNSDTKNLSVSNPTATMLIPVKSKTHWIDGTSRVVLSDTQLILYDDPTPTPDSDSTPDTGIDDDAPVKVPDTGASINSEEGSALAIFTATTFIILSVIAMIGIHKKHVSGHFKYDE